MLFSEKGTMNTDGNKTDVVEIDVIQIDKEKEMGLENNNHEHIILDVVLTILRTENIRMFTFIDIHVLFYCSSFKTSNVISSFV